MDRKNLNNYLRYSGLGIQMAFIIFIFSYIGKLIDGKLLNKNLIFTIIFSVLGIVIAIYMVIKEVSRDK